MLTRSGRGAIFADARVFDTAWVPSDFHSRDSQLHAMASALEPLLEDAPTTGLLLYGPSGTGKTSSGRYLLDRLHQHLFSLETATVNCWSDHTRYGVLYRIADQIAHLTPSTHERSSAALRDAIRSVEDPIVVFLDEADQLDEPELLYELYEDPGLEVVLTANRLEDVTTGLDDRLRSRLRTFRHVEFKPYATAELVPILEQRVRHGLQPDVIDDRLVDRIAEESDGDARNAIAALKGAAQAAVDAGGEVITAEYVSDALATAGRDVQRETVARLNDHQAAVYAIVVETGPTSPGHIFERYTDRVADPRSKRTVRKYLRKLTAYDLLTAAGTAQARTYEAVPGAPPPE